MNPVEAFGLSMWGGPEVGSYTARLRGGWHRRAREMELRRADTSLFQIVCHGMAVGPFLLVSSHLLPTPPHPTSKGWKSDCLLPVKWEKHL